MAAYLDSLNSCSADPLLSAMEAEARATKVPIIHPDTLAFTGQLLRIARAKRILEIGGAIGYFAIAIAKATGVCVTSLEIDPKLAELARANSHRSGLEGKITIIEGDALKLDPETLGDCDAILIDGAKGKYVDFFARYAPLLKPGGFIVSDNLLFRGQVAHPETILSRNRRQLIGKIQRFNEYLRARPDFATRFYEIGDGVAVSIKTR